MRHDGATVTSMPSSRPLLCPPDHKSASLEEEGDLFIEVECFNVEPELCPPPQGLTPQQVLASLSLGSHGFCQWSCPPNTLQFIFVLRRRHESPLSTLRNIYPIVVKPVILCRGCPGLYSDFTFVGITSAQDNPNTCIVSKI